MMQRSRLAFLFALALIPSACEFRACGLGCGGSNGSSNIPATPKVKPQPLKVPDPIPGEHGLAAAWFDNAEGLVTWARNINPEKFPKEITPESLREIITKTTGSAQLGENLDLTRSLGCVGFNVMEFVQGSSVPLSCVFHFKGGLSNLESALASSSPKKDGDRLLVTIQGRNLEFKEWPAKDAIWLTGGKTLAMQAKPVLEQKLADVNAGHKSRIELSLYIAQILSDYKIFIKPMIKKALKDFSAGLPLPSDKLDEGIDKTFAQLESLQELRVSFRATDSDAQLFFSESMEKSSEQLTALDQICAGPGIDPHLLGLLPDTSVMAVAQNLDFAASAKHGWTKENHEMLSQMIAAQTGKPFPHTHEEVSKYLKVVAEHFEGNVAASLLMFGPKHGAMAMLYQPKSGQSPREFWSKGLKAIAPHFKEHVNFDGSSTPVTIQGVEFDRYQAKDKNSTPENPTTAVVIDVGELDGIGIIAATGDKYIDQGTKSIVDALKGQGRFADTKNYPALASKFAGNHIGFASDVIKLMNEGSKPKTKLNPQGLGDFSIVMRGDPGKGLAVQLSLVNETITEISKGMKDKAIE